jgi:hypothetical protein
MADQRKWAIYFSAAAFAFVCAIAGYNLFRPSPNSTLADALKRSGYLEIRPAANLDGPGMIVTVDSKTEDAVMLHPTCNMDLTEVSNLWQSSPSVDTNTARALSGEFKLGAEVLEAAGLNAGTADEIDVSLDNTKVLVLSDESRFGLEAKYLKGECLEAVKATISHNKKCVTQPISALQADVNYSVKFSSNVAANDKAKIIDKLSATLSTDGHKDGSDTIKGKGLFVGLKLDTWCIVPDNGQPEKSVASVPVATASIAANSDNPARGPLAEHN